MDLARAAHWTRRLAPPDRPRRELARQARIEPTRRGVASEE
jgi:hypothetical protein